MAPARGVQCIEFVARVGEGAETAGGLAEEEAVEGTEEGGFPAQRPCVLTFLWLSIVVFGGKGLGVNEVRGDDLDANSVEVGETEDGAGCVRVVCGAGAIAEVT